VAEFVISAKRFGTGTDVVPQTTWEMLSRECVREAYLWQHLDLSGLEGGRDGVSVLVNWTNELAGSIVKSVVYYRRYLGIRNAESPIS
jgi:hypothetical protein